MAASHSFAKTLLVFARNLENSNLEDDATLHSVHDSILSSLLSQADSKTKQKHLEDLLQSFPFDQPTNTSSPLLHTKKKTNNNKRKQHTQQAITTSNPTAEEKLQLLFLSAICKLLSEQKEEQNEEAGVSRCLSVLRFVETIALPLLGVRLGLQQLRTELLSQETPFPQQQDGKEEEEEENNDIHPPKAGRTGRNKKAMQQIAISWQLEEEAVPRLIRRLCAQLTQFVEEGEEWYGLSAAALAQPLFCLCTFQLEMLCKDPSFLPKSYSMVFASGSANPTYLFHLACKLVSSRRLSHINEFKRFEEQAFTLALTLLHCDNASLRKGAIAALIPTFFRDIPQEPQQASANATDEFLKRLWESIVCTIKEPNAGEGIHSQRQRLSDNYLLLCRFFSHFFPATPHHLDLRREDSYWRLLQSGFVNEDSLIRKRSNYLLKKTIQYTSDEASKNMSQGEIVFSKYFIWDVQQAETLKHQWHTFFLLQEALEEFGYHLVEPLWPLLKTLCPSSSGARSNMHISWIQCILERAFSHDNDTIKKRSICNFLDDKEQVSSFMQLDFVLGPVMDALCNGVLYRGVIRTKIGDLIVQFYIRYFHQRTEASSFHSTDKEAKAHFVRSFLIAVASRPIFVGGALVAFLNVMAKLPPLPIFSCSASSSLTALKLIMDPHIPSKQNNMRQELYSNVLKIMALFIDKQECSEAMFDWISKLLALIPTKFFLQFAFQAPSWHLLKETLQQSDQTENSWISSILRSRLSSFMRDRGQKEDDEGDEHSKLSTKAAALARISLFLTCSEQQKILDSTLARIPKVNPSDASSRMEAKRAILFLASLLKVSISPSVTDRQSKLAYEAYLKHVRTSLKHNLPTVINYCSSQDINPNAAKLLRLPKVEVLCYCLTLFPQRDMLHAVLKRMVSAICTLLQGNEPSVSAAITLELMQCLRTLCPYLALLYQEPTDEGESTRNIPLQELIDGVMRSSLKQMSKNTTASSKSEWNYKFAKFTKLKWECAKLLITTFIQIQRNNEETIPTALAENIMEACVEGLDVATHDFIAPIFGCLALVIPHTLPSALYSSPATAEPSTQWLSKFEEVLEQGWMAQQQCKKFEGIDAFIGMVFQPALLQISALSANDASPLKRYFNRVMKAGEYYYGAVGRLAQRCCAVWRDSSTDIQVCFNFMPEIIELCLYGPQRKVLDVESNQLYSGGGAGLEHQDSFVRGCILAFLWSGLHLRLHKEKEKSGSARKKCVSLFVQQLLEQLLDLNFTAAYDSAYRLHSVGHRNRIRVWQTISLLVGRYLEGEMESSLVPILNSRIWRILEITNLRSVRNFVELVLVHMLLLRPELISSQKPQQEILESHKQQETAPEQGCLLSLLARINDRPEVVTAAIAVAGMLLGFLPADAPIYHPLFKALMVFITCHHVTIRTLAHVAFLKVVAARNDYFLHTLEAGEAQLVAACFRYLMGNDESQKAFEKHQHWLVPPSPPVEQMQPERVLYRLPLEQHLPTEECVHPKIFEYLCADGRTSDDAIPYDAIYQELTLEEQKENDRRTQETEQKLEGQREGGGKINNNYRSNEKQAFQKKIMPWAKEQTSDEVGGGERSGMSRRKGEEDKNETELSRILQFDHEMTRSEFLKASQRQEIIVVATLIDKVPNMAGLARTCEIFNASTLVLHSMAVTHERVFQSISVTAEKWLPIEAVPEKDLASYLRMKKEEDGFSLIGVEQTSNSISLAEFSFPKKTLLLLGKEKEGIPVEYIHLLDECIEIPQLGIIRSLNVHVSASIFLWEYTRQHKFTNK